MSPGVYRTQVTEMGQKTFYIPDNEKISLIFQNKTKVRFEDDLSVSNEGFHNFKSHKKVLKMKNFMKPTQDAACYKHHRNNSEI